MNELAQALIPESAHASPEHILEALPVERARRGRWWSFLDGAQQAASVAGDPTRLSNIVRCTSRPGHPGRPLRPRRPFAATPRHMAATLRRFPQVVLVGRRP
jgi:hypothetical protein